MKRKNIILYISSAVILLAPFAYIVYAYSLSYKMFHENPEIRQPLATSLYDRNGRLISHLYDEYRQYAGIDEIPETVIKAFLAAEDSSFYIHSGFDINGIARALFVDLISGELRQGGSTITQQLAKQLYAGRERSVKRKLVELFLAREFEKNYSKDRIMEMYLNQIYLGHGVYGVKAAAGFFFDKQLKELNIVEAAIIAGLPSAPDRYSPLKNPQGSHDKSLGILFNLISSGYIEKEKAAEMFNSFWKDFVEHNRTGFSDAGVRSESGRAMWFTEYIRRRLIEKFGEERVYRGGLRVFTTLDIDYQAAAEKIIEKSLAEYNRDISHVNSAEKYKIDAEFASAGLKGENLSKGESQTLINQRIKFNREYFNNTNSELQLLSLISGSDLPAEKAISFTESYNSLSRQSRAEGALVAVDNSTGGILAMVGGSEFRSVNQLNRAVQSRRQPGSAFKAFVYGAAIEEKKITAATPFYDIPLTYRGGKKTWSPSNYDKDYSGRVLARKALSRSLNIVSAKIYDLAGGDVIARFASNLTGVEYKRFQLDPTLSLGTTELSPIEIVSGFAVYANRGISLPVNGLIKIEDRNGKVLFTANNKGKRVVSEETSFIMTSMMREVVESGTASYAIKRGAGFRLPCAGKTGTNTKFRDAWFIGYTPDISAAVWVGCESPRFSLGRGRSGASVAAPLWGEFMKEIYRTRRSGKFPGMPSGVSSRTICSITGNTAEKGCPSRNEYFIKGTEPGTKCDGLHGRLSNIKELINREKRKDGERTSTELFSSGNDEGSEDESKEIFFFDD